MCILAIAVFTVLDPDVQLWKRRLRHLVIVCLVKAQLKVAGGALLRTHKKNKHMYQLVV